MSHFNQLPEFSQEFKKLFKKYRSLEQDISDLEDVLKTLPTGSGKNFIIIHSDSVVKIIKTRLACKSLKNRSIRIVYAYHVDIPKFVYLEIYFRGDKENEDRKRIDDYLKNNID